ncbi:MAG: hypothetical protein M3283_08900 [Actinomycetota bacterium]|nr:hypothetical protein [Actinomycetota bacterium]
MVPRPAGGYGSWVVARRRERVDEWQANVAREQAEVLGWRSPRETPDPSDG